MLRILLSKIQDIIPQGRNCFLKLMHTYHETVLHMMIDHELEDVVVNVAVNFDPWLHPYSDSNLF